MNTALTLGVVGHVDHGKTALVRALTGIETDRLKEERERGLSIVLGFSYLELDDVTVDLIDVPGHEDFIRAMISGATGIDGVMLCIAANEGVMPQTIEHFNIAQLLGVDRGFVVVTKTDLVDADGLSRIEADLVQFVANTFLEDAPAVMTSAQDGAGMDDVRAALSQLAAAPVERGAPERFFLPLDRVFTMRGFGLVGTGTLRGGALAVNDRVEIMPARKAATVRALQNHNRPIERASPGQRIAVNLRHIGRGEVRRGDVLATPGFLTPTRRIDAELGLLADCPAPLKNGATVRVLIGTTEAIAKLRLLDARELAPGATGLTQLRLDRDIATHRSERFLIRSYSPMRTIGGGRVLDVNAERHRRFDAAVTVRLETAATGDAERIAAQRLDEAAGMGLDAALLAQELGVPPAALERTLQQLDAVAVAQHRFVAAAVFRGLVADIVATLKRFHVSQPRRNGLPAGSLAKQLAVEPNADVLRCALEQLVADGRIHNTQQILSIAGFDPLATLGQRERTLAAELERAFLDAGIEPPPAPKLVGTDKTKQTVYRLLLETGTLVRLRTYDRNAQTVLHAVTLDRVRQTIGERYPHPQTFALKDIRDLFGSTRKYVLPIMEHLDASGTTLRTGDTRRLREP